MLVEHTPAFTINNELMKGGLRSAFLEYLLTAGRFAK